MSYHETHWTIVDTEDTYNTAMRCARGNYQRELIRGWHNISGSSMTSAMRQWGGSYAASRHSLIGRLRAAGLTVEVRAVDRRHVLVISR